MTPEALALTHAAAFAGERGWSAAEFADLLAARGAILSGDAAAFVLGRAMLDEAEILTVATRPERRRAGLARAALAAFEAAAAARGAARIFLEVAEDNGPARALYAGAGYARIGRRRAYYARPGAPSVDALVLEKRLPRS
ncbi:GNAT family N-acetyltransferase [Wenxinia saemankumensis]|uniref:Ribosomal-protein-alanine N-acetyltransferase n=1 Tax=Wenxinia saemankumensis TaxID=1447782 RepID=A0A1M6E0P4_9RHOB|nr:GNAT family N-acetyltransferase [Wenxinia saemankumensis]SHI79077.1 ribosomal-protein-alanine N-acetyltransferase [Wenxinia saemankumensis]